MSLNPLNNLSRTERKLFTRNCKVKRGHIDMLEAAIYRKELTSTLNQLEESSASKRACVDFLNLILDAKKADQISDEEAECFIEWVDNEEHNMSTKTDSYEKDAVLNSNIAKELVKRTEDNVRQQEELVNRVVDAKKALDLAATTVKKDMLDFLDSMSGYLTQMRQTRFALDTELKSVMASSSDVRKFFLSEQHDAEVSKLKEFVALCERLKALKESGFLDTVADTILRLESK